MILLFTIIQIKDLNTEDMTPFFPKLVETIEKGVVAGGILVHWCVAITAFVSSLRLFSTLPTSSFQSFC